MVKANCARDSSTVSLSMALPPSLRHFVGERRRAAEPLDLSAESDGREATGRGIEMGAGAPTIAAVHRL